MRKQEPEQLAALTAGLDFPRRTDAGERRDGNCWSRSNRRRLTSFYHGVRRICRGSVASLNALDYLLKPSRSGPARRSDRKEGGGQEERAGIPPLATNHLPPKEHTSTAKAFFFYPFSLVLFVPNIRRKPATNVEKRTDRATYITLKLPPRKNHIPFLLHCGHRPLVQTVAHLSTYKALTPHPPPCPPLPPPPTSGRESHHDEL